MVSGLTVQVQVSPLHIIYQNHTHPPQHSLSHVAEQCPRPIQTTPMCIGGTSPGKISPKRKVMISHIC